MTGCVLIAAGIWLLVLHVASAQAKDAAALKGFLALGRGWAETPGLGSPSPIAVTLFATGAAGLAILQRTPRLAVIVPAVLACAAVTAEGLKPLLAHAHPDVAPFHMTAASYPSGSATMVMAMALCAVMVAPARLQLAVLALAGLVTVAAGLALVGRGAHLPSDVLGGFAVAGTWASVALVIVVAIDRRWPKRPRARPSVGARAHAGGPWLAMCVIAGGVTFAPIVATAIALQRGLVAHAASANPGGAIGGAAVVGAGAAAILTGFAAALGVSTGSHVTPTAHATRGGEAMNG